MSERDGAAKRRRERRLRSWAKHERQTVAMALAEALHHSAPRRQKLGRAGVPEDPGPRRETEHEQHAAQRGPKPPSLGVPLVAAPLLAAPAADCVDEAALSFLLQRALEDKRKEEQLAKEEKEKRKQMVLDSLEQTLQQMLGHESSSSAVQRRKRKKRRKRRLPRSPRPLLRGRARRRQRQWLACNAGLPGDVPLLDVFSSVVVRPEMLDIMAVMYQKDSTALVVNHGSGMCRVGFTGYDAPRVMFPSGVVKPMMLGILAGMDRKDSSDRCPCSRLLNLESPQLQSIQVVDISSVAQRQSLMVQTVRWTIDIPQLCTRLSTFLLCRSSRFTSPSWRSGSFHGPICSSDHRHSPVAQHGGRCPCCVVLQVLQFSRADVERQPSSHSCSFLNSGLVVACLLCATTGARWFGVQKTAVVRSCSALTW